MFSRSCTSFGSSSSSQSSTGAFRIVDGQLCPLAEMLYSKSGIAEAEKEFNRVSWCLLYINKTHGRPLLIYDLEYLLNFEDQVRIVEHPERQIRSRSLYLSKESEYLNFKGTFFFDKLTQFQYILWFIQKQCILEIFQTWNLIRLVFLEVN